MIRFSPMRLTFLILLGCALPLPPAHPDDSFSLSDLETALKQDPSNRQLLLEVASRYHNLLLTEPTEKVWKNAERWFDLLEKQFKIKRSARHGTPADPWALALDGSYNILRGQRVMKKQSKLGKYYTNTYFINEGIANLDRAVEMDMKNLKTRLVRAMNGYVSQRPNRLPVSLEDFKYLAATWDRDPEKDLGLGITLPELFLVWGKCARLDKDFLLAREIWSLLKKKYPGSMEAAEAEKLSAEIEEDAKKQRFILEHKVLKQPGKP